ncbi:MAG: hypothetical protein IT437_02635, partial [Phycisphaerales bacterium]|nr:hypothetical protein [Phycisphaerales bacterium]
MAASVVPAVRGQGDPGSYDTCDQSAVLFQAFSRDDPGISYELQPRSDPDIAIGGCHLVAISNFGIKGFAKSSQAGSLSRRLTKQPMGSLQDVLWSPPTTQQPPYPVYFFSRSFDPRVIYDSATSRFWATSLVFERYDDVVPPGTTLFTPRQYSVGLAVSKDGDPNPTTSDLGWRVYRVDVTAAIADLGGTTSRIDNPSIAVDSDYLYYQFGSTSDYWHLGRLDKAALMNGTAPAVISVQPGDVNFFRVFDTWAKVAVRYGPDDGHAQYIVNDGFEALGGASGDTLRLYALRRDTTSATLATFTLQVPEYFSAATAPQPAPPPPGQAVPVGTDNGKIMALPVYRNGHLWVTHTVRHAGGGGRAFVRWYKVQMNGWPQSGQQPTSPAQWGEIEVPSDWSAYFPSIAVDSLNNAAITFNVSGTDKFISMWQA